ncbi:sigma-70 family RNA polymerase sigma factor [soil metagenome]
MDSGAKVSGSPLLPRVARGDAIAVRELVTRYERLVWALALRHCVDTTDAEDAVQDVFLSLWQNAERFDPARASEPVFITVIARRRLIDRARGRRRRPVTEVLDDALPATGELHPERCVEAARAVRALETLSADQRMVLVLSTRDGMTHEEIAEHTGFPLGTVKTHTRRALIRVREILLGKQPEAEGQR